MTGKDRHAYEKIMVSVRGRYRSLSGVSNAAIDVGLGEPFYFFTPISLSASLSVSLSLSPPSQSLSSFLPIPLSPSPSFSLSLSLFIKNILKSMLLSIYHIPEQVMSCTS